jgi:hypothetical protein
MSDDKLDPRMQQMVAALYGELSESEETEFRELLASDPRLQAEWAELQESRFALAALEQEEAAPSFVFLGEEDERRALSHTPGGVGDRIRGFLDRLGSGPAWGLAATAVLALVLGLSGFRVQKIDGGFAFRFGEAEPPVFTADVPAPPQTLDSVIGNEARPPMSMGTVGATPVAGEHYLSRQEMVDYESQVLQLMSAMLKDYSRYRDQELAGIIRSMYAEMNHKQERVYDDLRGRIEAVNVGLMLESNRTESLYDDLLDGKDNDAPPEPAGDDAADDGEKEN